MQPGMARVVLAACALANLLAAIAFFCLSYYSMAFAVALMAIAWFIGARTYKGGE